jgi:hypothetical protein
VVDVDVTYVVIAATLPDMYAAFVIDLAAVTPRVVTPMYEWRFPEPVVKCVSEKSSFPRKILLASIEPAAYMKAFEKFCCVIMFIAKFLSIMRTARENLEAFSPLADAPIGAL